MNTPLSAVSSQNRTPISISYIIHVTWTSSIQRKSPYQYNVKKYASLQLKLQQVGNHLASGDARGLPQCREVQGAAEGIGVTEEEHGRDPATGVLEREARLVHLVLLDLTADQVVHATGGIDLRFEFTGHVGQLSSLKDIEIIVGGVATAVAFGANGGTCRD